MKKGAGKMILLVEDEALISAATSRTLQRFGFTVRTAPTGERAVEAVETDPDIDLVLMDIDLGPGIDGAEAARRILRIRDLPLVFHSAHTEPEVVEKTEDITSYGYIVKNSGDTVLGASIRMAFRLWESEAKFRTAFESVAVGMVLTSPDGKLLRVNQEFCSMLGYTREELASLDFAALTHPDDVETSRARMTALRNGESDRTRFKKRYVHKDGREIWADLSVVLLRDSAGKPLHFVTHIQDITEDRRIREELERSRSRFDLLLRSVPASILVVQDGRYVFANPYGARLLGYESPENLVGTLQFDSIDVESREAVKLRMARIALGESNDPRELIVLRKDGTRVTTESASLPIEYDGRPAALILGRDKTEQKAVEGRLASILKAVPTGIGVVQGPDREIREVNDKLCEMTGYSREELEGRSIALFYADPAEYERIGREKYRQMEERGYGTAETVWRHKDGRTLDVFLASAPLYPGDLSRGVTFAALDITERKRAEEAVRSLLQEKDLLLRETHHRVKNNLGLVHSLLSLQAGRQADPAARGVLGDAAVRVQAMSRLYDRLYRSENFREMSLKSFLPGIVDQVRDLFRLDAEVRADLRIEDIPLPVRTLTPLGIILNELVTNSMKYAFQGRPEGRITLTALRDGPVVRITYGDDGPGLPESFNLDTPAGFGLQLCGILSGQLGGTLRLERDRGTRFVLEFPAN
ncbi:MAG TPA: PAS domain S-box protein [Spirochaetia bacterium]|nr:PAS domain S-box protein [Spirochaetia bacterium]